MTWKTTSGGLREYLRHFDTEELVIRESWFDTCPRCGSRNTWLITVNHSSTSVKTLRHCYNCWKQWSTEVFSDEFLDMDFEDESEGE